MKEQQQKGLMEFIDRHGMQATCGVEIDGHRVIITEIDEYPGTIGPVIGQLAAHLTEQFGQDWTPSEIIWIENYGDQFYQVKFKYNVVHRGRCLYLQPTRSPALFQ